MKNIFQEALNLLNCGESFALATILERHGSAPRSIGARMIVRKDGSIIGTIGGGLLEAQVCDAGRSAMSDKRSRIHDYHFNARQASDLGMICGGSVRILIQYIPAGDDNLLALFREISQLMESHQKSWLLTIIMDNARSQEDIEIQQGFMQDNGTLSGQIKINPTVALQAARQVHGSDPSWMKVDDQLVLFEPIHTQGRLYIFGAGHISQMLAPLAAWVGFYTIVLDDREDFANRERFPSIDEVLHVKSFQDCFSQIAIDQDSYLVIVTRGHLDDQVVLREALNSQAGYIGMIGSLRKRDLIYKDLLATGVSPDDLKRVNSPIGLTIGAETPEEIAISILGELIQARSNRVNQLATIDD